MSSAIVQAQVLEEVVVTAERRSQSIQDVPLSVAAIGGDDITVGKISDLNDIAFAVPGVSFNQFNVGEPRFYRRGIGNSSDSAASDQAVGVFLDEVYIGRTGGVGFDLFDLERIEILRGPQGTLYGKNTNGGAINIVTTRPSQEGEVKLSASAGNYSMYNVNGLVNGGITDTLAGKLVMQYQERDGFGKNVISPDEIATLGDFSNSKLIGGSIGASGSGDELDDQEKRSIRGQLLWDISESTSLLLGADYSKDETNGSCRHLQNLDEAIQGLGVFWELGMSKRYMDDDRHCSTQFNTDQEREVKGAMARLDMDLNWATLTSITAYRESEYDFLDDLTGIPLLDLNAQTPPGLPLPPLPGIWTAPENVIDAVDEDADQFSQEFRLTGTTGSIDWVSGAFYMEENVERDEEFYTQYNTLLQLGLGLPGIGNVLFTQDNETTSMALYGQADWHINERWTLTYGLRWSDDEKDIEQGALDLLGTEPSGVPLLAPPFAVKADDSWSELTNKVSVSYTPSEDMMLYVTYSEGFKSGAFPSQTSTAEDAAKAADPEEVTNYEVGMKSAWWDNRIQFNVSYYFMDYDDLQVFELNDRLLLVLNSAQAESEGVDLEFNILPTENLMISTSYNYSDATYTDYVTPTGVDNSDNDLVFAPENAFTVNADYHLDMDSWGALDFNANYSWKDDYYTAPSNAEKTRQKDIGMIGASAKWTSVDQSWEVTLWGKNIDDAQQIANRIVDPTQITSEMYMAPRTYGATVTKTF
jgi:iron complex outermembrane receptor protein